MMSPILKHEGKSVAIEIDHDDPFRAGTCDMLGRREHQTELRRVDAIRIGLGRGCTRFGLLRHFTERQRDGLLFALAPNREFRRATRSHVADLLGKVADIVDRLTVQCGDDIAREDASLRGGAVRERFGDQRAFVFLHTEAFGDIGGDGLDLHADPAPASLRRAFLGIRGRRRREHRLAGTARAKEKCGGSEARAGGKKDKTPRRTSAIQFVSRTDHSVSIGLMALRAPCWAAK